MLSTQHGLIILFETLNFLKADQLYLRWSKESFSQRVQWQHCEVVYRAIIVFFFKKFYIRYFNIVPSVQLKFKVQHDSACDGRVHAERILL